MSELAAIRDKSGARIAGLACGLFVVHLLFLIWFSGKPSHSSSVLLPITRVEAPPAARPSAHVPASTGPADYVLPSLLGFSGPAWLEFKTQEYSTAAWTEPARELSAPIEQLDETLGEFLERKDVVNLSGVSIWEADVPQILPLGFVPLVKSRLEVRDGLAFWASNSIPELKPQAFGEILQSSIVQTGVDEDGNVFSAVLLRSGKSGSPAADAEAVALTRAAKFFRAPARQESAEFGRKPAALHWGRLVFHWATVPLMKASAPVTGGVEDPDGKRTP